jgi:hypothetical protein
MKIKILATVAMALFMTSATSSRADFLLYNLVSPNGIFAASEVGQLPADSWYQIWWSADGDIAGTGTMFGAPDGDIEVASATATSPGTVDTRSSDILLFAGQTTDPGGFSAGAKSFSDHDDADVGGADIHSGWLYAILYHNDTVPGPPTEPVAVGTHALYSDIVDASTIETTGGVPGPPTEIGWQTIQIIDDGSNSEVIDNVPEPGTMALFALGLATIAWRRRKN